MNDRIRRPLRARGPWPLGKWGSLGFSFAIALAAGTFAFGSHMSLGSSCLIGAISGFFISLILRRL